MKLDKPDRLKADTKDIVVFIIRRETKCAECGEELEPGRWIRVENDKALCLACADLAHLEYLPSGNTALTRRATKHSPLRAVVVQWARARNRYERQGILIIAEACAARRRSVWLTRNAAPGNANGRRNAARTRTRNIWLLSRQS